jgi:hypothetical protein
LHESIFHPESLELGSDFFKFSAGGCVSATMMLGRKQSLRGDSGLADYGPEETQSESTDTEWVNKVIIFSLTYSKLPMEICQK